MHGERDVIRSLSSLIGACLASASRGRQICATVEDMDESSGCKKQRIASRAAFCSQLN